MPGELCKYESLSQCGGILCYLIPSPMRYANDGHYKDAIKDFEKALTINHTHRNARKYLVETQVALGKE